LPERATRVRLAMISALSFFARNQTKINSKIVLQLPLLSGIINSRRYDIFRFKFLNIKNFLTMITGGNN
jgi:hypothetical protein